MYYKQTDWQADEVEAETDTERQRQTHRERHNCHNAVTEARASATRP